MADGISEGFGNLDVELLKDLAESRKEESILLYKNHQYNGSYYLGGYALECAFKSLIAVSMKKHIFPDIRFVREVWIHKLEKLKDNCVLKKEFDDVLKDDKYLSNWETAKKWDESSRYKQITIQEAVEFNNALFDSEKGIYTWLRKNWDRIE